jgi:hypothetical protein
MQLVAVEVALTTRCPYRIQSHTWEARETVGRRLASPTKPRTKSPELKEAAFKSDTFVKEESMRSMSGCAFGPAIEVAI